MTSEVSASEVRGRTAQRGMVLVVVLWIVLGLVALLLLFGDSMRMEYKASANSVAAIEAGQALSGAQRYLAYVLTNVTTPGEMPTSDSFEAEKVPVGNAFFWVVGRSDEELKEADTPVFGFVDEASKLNLNTATREMIELLPNMTTDVAAAIVDWRSAPNNAQPDGAQSPVYMALNPPYQCKNAPFETVEELRLVRGVTEELLYGPDRNRNGVLDPNEVEDGPQGAVQRGIMDLVTVASREPNTQKGGAARINVRDTGTPRTTGANTTPSNANQQLQVYLQGKLGAGRAAAIVAATGDQAGSLNSVLQFYIVGGVTMDEALLIDDGLTVSNAPVIVGRVNVNTAPREVLMCLPGIGEKFADALIALRRSKSPEQLASIRWVLEAIDPQSATQAGPYITTRTYQVSADVAAVGRNGRALQRAWMVFDMTGTSPIVIDRHDQTHLGWPLGTATREELDSGTTGDKEGL